MHGLSQHQPRREVTALCRALTLPLAPAVSRGTEREGSCASINKASKQVQASHPTGMLGMSSVCHCTEGSGCAPHFVTCCCRAVRLTCSLQHQEQSSLWAEGLTCSFQHQQRSCWVFYAEKKQSQRPTASLREKEQLHPDTPPFSSAIHG